MEAMIRRVHAVQARGLTVESIDVPDWLFREIWDGSHISFFQAEPCVEMRFMGIPLRVGP